ncbi:hypothetical protein H072_6096 [Dactylellina haptotyla CBS 200.50]|uniref:Uncharacterized protein n=1 Tax=Dactylellina haptotyla (strain CBS 200.50) TaxID=1284197 RepID=S8BKZ9_DACHA|nr:hypothetical protein H072_6096 [Dactylellina haptotyla CBS 200.50]
MSVPVIDLTGSPPRKRQRVFIDLTGTDVAPSPYQSDLNGLDDDTHRHSPSAFTSPPLSPSDPLNNYFPPATLDPWTSQSPDPEIDWLWHVKRIADENLSASDTAPAPHSTHTSHLHPSEATEAFFINDGMTQADRLGLAGDIELARKIGFLPFTSEENARSSIVRFAREEYLRQKQLQNTYNNYNNNINNYNCTAPNGMVPAAVNIEVETEEEEEEAEEEDVDNWAANVLPPMMDKHWYPGTFYYMKMRGEWFAKYPAVRARTGVPGFLNERWDGEHEKQTFKADMYKFDWHAWARKCNR